MLEFYQIRPKKKAACCRKIGQRETRGLLLCLGTPVGNLSNASSLLSLVSSTFFFLSCSASSKDSSQSKIIHFTLGQKKISRLELVHVPQSMVSTQPLVPFVLAALPLVLRPLTCLQFGKTKHALADDQVLSVRVLRVSLGWRWKGCVCVCDDCEV